MNREDLLIWVMGTTLAISLVVAKLCVAEPATPQPPCQVASARQLPSTAGAVVNEKSLFRSDGVLAVRYSHLNTFDSAGQELFVS